jgi:hypothetical protein
MVRGASSTQCTRSVEDHQGSAPVASLRESAAETAVVVERVFDR